MAVLPSVLLGARRQTLGPRFTNHSGDSHFSGLQRTNIPGSPRAAPRLIAVALLYAECLELTQVRSRVRRWL
jgi:hypothetical protein